MLRSNTHGNENGNGAGVGLADEIDPLDADLLSDERTPEQAATGQKEKRTKGKRAGLAIIALILITGVIGALFMSGFFSRTQVVNVDVPAKTQQPAPNSPDTEQSIAALGQQIRTNAPVVQEQPGAQTPIIMPGQTPVTGTTPEVGNTPVSTTYPGMETVPNGVAGTVQSTPTASTSSAPQSASRPSQPRHVPLSQIDSEPAKQTSTYFFSDPAVKPGAPSGVPTFAAGSPASAASVRTAPVVPPFGATLPVRSLGAIYSLRREGYVRMETTRMVKGDGWSLPRGTQLIGRLSGAQDNRVFVSLLGYIAGGKLVRVGGEVNGVDGGAGLQGSKKRIGNRFLKAMRGIGNAGLQAFNSWLAGRSGGTQIFVPNSSIREALPNSSPSVTEYVAVKAGTLGSVMVTDLPEAVDGAQPDVDGETADTGGNMMSDDEVIELMTTGTPEEIRTALPRMPAQLRPLAEAAIKDR